MDDWKDKYIQILEKIILNCAVNSDCPTELTYLQEVPLSICGSEHHCLKCWKEAFRAYKKNVENK